MLQEITRQARNVRQYKSLLPLSRTSYHSVPARKDQRGSQASLSQRQTTKSEIRTGLYSLTKPKTIGKKISKWMEPCGQLAALSWACSIPVCHWALLAQVMPRPTADHTELPRALCGTCPTTRLCPARCGSCWALHPWEKPVERAVIMKLLPVAKTALALAVTLCLLLPTSVSFYLSVPFLEAGKGIPGQHPSLGSCLPPACCSRCLPSPSGTPPCSLPFLPGDVLWLRWKVRVHSLLTFWKYITVCVCT